MNTHRRVQMHMYEIATHVPGVLDVREASCIYAHARLRACKIANVAYMQCMNVR
jgi:hypothetical protein